ncbi:MAG TPA: hypothetical protein VEI74_00705 [Candidatus Methylomirabilis sp.]|nr:hypothetical protein [Candidatus Methylomirabilis sp.]
MSFRKEIGILLGVGVAAAVIFGPLWWRPVSPCVFGDMADRGQARVPQALKEIYLDAERIRFGLGSAAVGGWDSLGDAVVTGGEAWVRTTNTRSPKYYEVVSNRYFQSNALVYIAPDVASESSWRPTQATPLPELWSTLAKKFPGGVMFAGYVRLAPLHLIAIARPAIDGRPVPQNAPYYYTRPMQSAPDAWAYVVGIAAGDTDAARPDRNWLGALLNIAAHRDDHGVGLTHVLWLKSAPAATALPPTRAEVASVGQLVADSAIAEGELKLYPVTRAGVCDAIARPR